MKSWDSQTAKTLRYCGVVWEGGREGGRGGVGYGADGLRRRGQDEREEGEQGRRHRNMLGVRLLRFTHVCTCVVCFLL